MEGGGRGKNDVHIITHLVHMPANIGFYGVSRGKSGDGEWGWRGIPLSAPCAHRQCPLCT